MEVTQKRILYVITKAAWGGAQRYVYDLATNAQNEGHAVLVAVGGTGPLLDRLHEAGVETHSIGGLGRDIKLSGEFAAYRELRSLMQEWKPSVVHLNSSKAGIAALAARNARVPHIIFTVHGWAWNERRPIWQKIIIAWIYWVTLLLSHKAIVVSNAVHQQARFLPFVQKKFVVIHNGIHPLPLLVKEEARTKLKLTQPFVVGTIAELHHIKGLPTLINAFARFHKEVPESELIIIGEGEERKELEELIAKEELDDHIHLPGHVAHAATYLKAFDVFILPSRSEALAYVLLEAGQASLPVIASNVGGLPEIIENEKTGLLVEYGDTCGFLHALETLAKDPEQARKYATALHAKVEEDFSLAHMIERTFALY